MFNEQYLHPWYDLSQFKQESQQCSDLLEEWIQDAAGVSSWGTLVIRKSTEEFPSKMFSFSPHVQFGPARAKANPRLHPTRFQSHPKDVMIHVPAKGPLPMGSFCGADGYGLIHPNMISAAVLQCCIASSQESDNQFKFDAMPLAPNMDLLMSCKDAERVAQTIAHWNCGKPRTDKLELIRPPGGDMSSGDVATADWNVHVRKQTELVFRYKPFRHWTSTTVEYSKEQRRVDREGVVNLLKATENSLFTHMAILNTQMGANLRAYHYFRNQELLGMKPVEKITLLQVKEVIDKVVDSKWVSPASVNTYLKYLPSAGGGLQAITEDFKGRKRLKVLWDVTGYEVAQASWSMPKTKEEYFKTLAVFWSMNAPVVLPTLPGIGSDPVKIGSIKFPSAMWEKDDRIGCKYTPMSVEELAEPITPRRPSLVRKTPDVGHDLWHPVLSNSEHAYGWWMLSSDELDILIAEIKDRTERTVTSRMAAPKSKQQVPVKKEKPTPKPKGTTPKSGSSGTTSPAKSKSTAIATSPVQHTQVPPQGLVSKELKSPPPQSIQYSSAGIREQSNPRGTVQKSEGGLMSYFQRGRLSSMGQGTPSIAPEQAKGAVPRPPGADTPPRSRSEERKRGSSTPRADTPPRSKSAERSDGRSGGDTPILQPTLMMPTTSAWLDAPRRAESRDPLREPPGTPEGLGSIVIGGTEEQAAAPPQETDNRSSSMGRISRVISAISSIGRGPQIFRDRIPSQSLGHVLCCFLCGDWILSDCYGLSQFREKPRNVCGHV